MNQQLQRYKHNLYRVFLPGLLGVCLLPGCLSAADCGPLSSYGPVQAQVCENDGLFGPQTWVTLTNTGDAVVDPRDWVEIEGAPTQSTPSSLDIDRTATVSLDDARTQASALLLPGPKLQERARNGADSPKSPTGLAPR